MSDLITKAAELISELEPTRDPRTTTVLIAGCDRDPAHHHPYPGGYDQKPDLPALRTVTLGAAAQLPLLELENHDPVTRVEQILHALTDRRLSDAALAVRSFQGIAPLENDDKEILAKMISVSDLDSLAYEYLKYEEDVYEMLSDYGITDESNPYVAAINAEMTRVCDELEQIRRLTLGSARAREILSGEARVRLGDELDTTPVYTVIQRPILNQERTEPGKSSESSWAVPIWLAFQDTNGLYADTLTTLPRWAVDLLREVAPRTIGSVPYPVHATDAGLIETAEALWVGGGCYQHFDDAMRAAEAVLQP